MMPVLRLAATAIGAVPTGMVAVTRQLTAAFAVLGAEAADTAGAIALAVIASPASIIVIKVIDRCECFMMSCFLAWERAGAYHLADGGLAAPLGLRLAAAPVNKMNTQW